MNQAAWSKDVYDYLIPTRQRCHLVETAEFYAGSPSLDFGFPLFRPSPWIPRSFFVFFVFFVPFVVRFRFRRNQSFVRPSFAISAPSAVHRRRSFSVTSVSPR